MFRKSMLLLLSVLVLTMVSSRYDTRGYADDNAANPPSQNVSGSDIDFDRGELIIGTFFTASTQPASETEPGRPIDKRIGLYASNNGTTFKYLGETGVTGRDAGLLYKDGYFYMLVTPADKENFGVVVYKSKDLVNWTSSSNARYDILNIPDKRPGIVYSWGPKWLQEGDKTYVVISFESSQPRITHGLLPFNPYPIMDTYVIPIESWGTSAQKANLNVKSITFGEPKKVNWGEGEGISFKYYQGAMEQISRIGANIYTSADSKQKFGYRYIMFVKVDPWGEIETWGSDHIYTSEPWTRISNYLAYSSTTTEPPNAMIDVPNNKFKRIFEGNYMVPLGDKYYFYTDNYSYKSTGLVTDGGMYYTTFTDLATGFTNPTPIQVTHTEDRPYGIESYVTRNGTISKITNLQAIQALKNFNDNKVSYSTTEPTTGSVTVTIRSNKSLQAVTGWTRSSNLIRLTKVFTQNGSEQVVLKDETGKILETISVQVQNIVPSNRQPTTTITSFTDGQRMNVNTPVFTWSFSDPDAGNVQAAYQVQGSTDNWATVVFDTGQLPGPQSSYTTSALADNDSWSIRIRTMDQAGAWSNWANRTIAVDTTAPVTTAAVRAADGLNGWHITNPTIALSAIDSASGVAQTLYRIDNGSWLAYSQPVVITEEGIHQFEFRSTDSAGNVESPQAVTIKLDKTPPTLQVVPSQVTLWPVNHKMVTVTAAVYANDTVSQIASTLLTSITSNEPLNGSDDIQGADYGTNDTTFMLRAERSGSGSGRIYTITYTATDTAGNTATQSAVVTVPHDYSGK